jgi:polysaccharide biosynthesis protein PslJ
LAALLTGFIDHYFSFTQVLVALFWLTMAISLQQSRPAPAPRSTSP